MVSMMSARGGSAASRTALSKSPHRNWAWFGTELEDTPDKGEPRTSGARGRGRALLGSRQRVAQHHMQGVWQREEVVRMGEPAQPPPDHQVHVS